VELSGSQPYSSPQNVASGRDVLGEALSLYRMDPGLALHRAAEVELIRALRLPGPILDLGCHDGDFSWLALRLSASRSDIIGCDRDVGALARCRNRGMHRALVGVDAVRLPFQSGAFGSVVCNSVLAHLDALPEALGEIGRVLMPGGVLAATVPTPAFHALFAPVRALRAVGLHRAAAGVSAAYDRRWHQRNFLDESAWREALGGAGLSLEKWTGYLGPRASLQWSSLFLLTRAGVGRFTLGGLLRRLFPVAAARTVRLERGMAAWLAPALGAHPRGGSALLLARRSAP
jgi:SAM-dependent methyltransferase